MPDTLAIVTEAVALIVKATMYSAQWASAGRKRALAKLAAMTDQEKEREILLLCERIAQHEQLISILQRQIQDRGKKHRFQIRERLAILWCLEYFEVPRSKVQEYFGASRASLYRWLHRIQDDESSMRIPENKTPEELATKVWEIAGNNAGWGRVRIASQIKRLGAFLGASTVRNILSRSAPKKKGPEAQSMATKDSDGKTDEKAPRKIPAWYPNHVWGIDLTEVRAMGIFPIQILVIIDHFSRKAMAVTPLEGPNAAWVVQAVEDAIAKNGKPKHVITDQGTVFKSELFREFLKGYSVKQRFGAVGKHGSIAVVERLIETLKYEWLKRAACLRGRV